MLLNNQLAFDHAVKDKEYQQAQQRGFKLEEIPVAIDGIAIAVNPNLNIPGLTLSQLKDIYTGKIAGNLARVGEKINIYYHYPKSVREVPLNFSSITFWTKKSSVKMLKKFLLLLRP